MSFHNHICGCYFVYNHYHRKYLPQVRLESHTTINPVAFTTELTQTFHNSTDEAIKSLRYAFPLYDGVAVNGYSISYADKTIVGVVKQKEQAKQTFQAAVYRGETAGLLESLPAGVFGVTLGNVPAKTDIVVELTYAGELKHDASTDGLRYMLPTSIAPRYGSYPGELLQTTNTSAAGGISITVDIDMGKSAIRRVQSPSHPIALSMGELSTAVKDSKDPSPFTPSQASATLTLGTTELAGDFILQLLIDDISKPQAILEVHPTLPSQRAIMTTMVPKFVLESSLPEIVFIADQSGSMSGSKNAALVKALKVFLKSLPVGVRFNICAFGSRHEFLWQKSAAYSETNVNKALKFVEGLTASYGGTEIFQPIQETFKRHLKDMPLEVMLLTDGEIWGEQQVFTFINEQIRDKKVDARVFALGIGQDVSHTLVEGVARAGNGFAQFVTQNEDTDQKVIRMLKGALYAHTKNYELEVHYADEEKMEDADDYFEIVEKVNDCLVIKGPAPAEKPPVEAIKPMSFFDTSADLDKPVNEKVEGADRYAHLPPIDTPKVLQAPADIPPMFPFSRTTAYLLLGPDSAQKDVKSITLRATSPQGPLELNIPIQGVQSGLSIHQLAARKTIQDLEEGRGWLQSVMVKSADGKQVSIKKKYESRFDELVEREGVRLGERFQVASKWTSFVAVEDHSGETEKNEAEQDPEVAQRARQKRRESHKPVTSRQWNTDAGGRDRDTGGLLLARDGRSSRPKPTAFGSAAASTGGGLSGHAASAQPSSAGSSIDGPFGLPQTAIAQQNSYSGGGALFGSANVSAYGAPPPAPSGGSLFGGAPRQQRMAMKRQAPPPPAALYAPPPPAARAAATVDAFVQEECEMEESAEDMGYGLFDDRPGPVAQAAALAPPQASISQAQMDQYSKEMQSAACMPLPDEDDEIMGLAITPPATRSSPVKKRKAGARSSRAARKSAPSPGDVASNILHDLIDLQAFSGAWAWSEDVLDSFGLEEKDVDKTKFGGDSDIAATALVVAFFENNLSAKKDVWEMVVAKARSWMMTKLGNAGKVDDVVRTAHGILEDAF